MTKASEEYFVASGISSMMIDVVLVIACERADLRTTVAT